MDSTQPSVTPPIVTSPIVLAVVGRITPADVPPLYAQVEECLAEAAELGATEVVCDVGGLRRPSLAAVNLLAKLRLAGRRRGCRVRLQRAGPELLDLLGLVGLAELAESQAAG
ncbi:STAS domain-containing protein [Streptomyces sp. NPDC001941]|uniref:STAS domain-containing protein n=1 Tax=Streptomyces sp. NPDC001941 TaxID=3154659 RepID=UPI003331D237